METITTFISTPRLIVAVNRKMYTLIGWQIIRCKNQTEFKIQFQDADFDTEYDDSCDDYLLENKRVKLAAEDVMLVRHYPITAEEGIVAIRKAEIMDIGFPGMEINNFDLNKIMPAQELYYNFDYKSRIEDSCSNSKFNICGFISDLKIHGVKIKTKSFLIELTIFIDEDDDGNLINAQAWISSGTKSDVYSPVIIENIENKECLGKFAFLIAAWESYTNCEAKIIVDAYDEGYADKLSEELKAISKHIKEESFL